MYLPLFKVTKEICQILNQHCQTILIHSISPRLQVCILFVKEQGVISIFESYKLLINFPFDVLTALTSVLCFHC